MRESRMKTATRVSYFGYISAIIFSNVKAITEIIVLIIAFLTPLPKVGIIISPLVVAARVLDEDMSQS